MEQILEELNQTPGVFGSMIIGKDGLVIANIWNQEIDLDMIGADTADILNTVEGMAEEKFLYGPVDILSLEAENAKLFIKNVDEGTFMAVAAMPKSNMGLLRAEIQHAAHKLEDEL